LKLRTRVLGAVGSVALAGSMAFLAAPAHAAPQIVGNCGGAVSLATLTPPIGDQTQPEVASTKLLKSVLGLKPTLGGVCNVPAPLANGHSTIHPKSFSGKLAGNASCASGAAAQAADASAAAAYPLNGKIAATMTETGADTKPLGIQSYIALLGAQANNNPNGDVINFGGINIKGVLVGATVTGSIWQDPVSKLAGKARSGVVLTTASGTNNVSSPASGVGAAKFVATDVGGTISGTNIPAGAVITAVNSATSATFSGAAATGSGTNSDGVLNAGNYDTGYLLDVGSAVGCADGTANNATITNTLVGGGGTSTVSVLGGQGQGFIYSFGQ
jgi:hypothetical protein